MSSISDALTRKKDILPQFDYMWRVELPPLDVSGMTDPDGIALLNTAIPALNIAGGGGSNHLVGRVQNFANNKISEAQSAVTGYAQKTLDFAREKASGIPGYSFVEEMLGGGAGNPVGGILSSSAAVSSLMKSNSKGSQISHRVYSIDVPFQSIEVNKHAHGSTFYFTAGTTEVGSLSLKLDEYEDGDSLRYLEAWRSLIMNSDGTHNPPATYKRDIKLIRMSNSGLDLHVTIYKDCFPSDISPASFSYDTNSITQYSVTFTGDRVEHILIPASEVISGIQSMQDSIMDGNGYGDGDFFSLSLSRLGSAAAGNLLNKVLDSKTMSNVVNKVKNFFF